MMAPIGSPSPGGNIAGDAMNKTFASDAADLLGRLFLAALFLWDVWIIVPSYGATASYMEQNGVPGLLLPLVLLTQFAGGLLVAIGWQARLAALALAGFCLMTALMFHSPSGEMAERIHFWKDLGLAGGFLVLFAHGAGRYSLDGRFRKMPA
jgi:putative oxidoreductase